jgi:LysR family transcriptional regulator, cys regulon transcriptional activator
MTEPGTQVLPIIERLLADSDNLRNAAKDFSSHSAGPLSIAATHSQARYALPAAVKDFRVLYPQVTLSLHQGSPRQVAEMLLSGEADIGIATEALAQYDQLVTLPCYRWTHAIVVPPGHPLLDGEPLTLQRLSHFPLVTYDAGYTGRSHIDEAFSRAGIRPSIVLTAMDADVIKTYAELGLGVGIVASIAYDAGRDRELASLDAGHLFEVNMTRLALRRGVFLRGYIYAFIETFAPPLTRAVVQEARLAGA